jgi:hypothetical protein
VLTDDCPIGLRAVVQRVSRVAGAVLTALLSYGGLSAQAPAQGTVRLLVLGDERPGERISGVVYDASGAIIPGARSNLFNPVQANHQSLSLLRTSTEPSGSERLMPEPIRFSFTRQVSVGLLAR